VSLFETGWFNRLRSVKARAHLGADPALALHNVATTRFKDDRIESEVRSEVS